MKKSILPIVQILLLTAVIAFPSTLHPQFVERKTDWLYQGKIGLSTHYVVSNPDTLKYWAKQFQADKVASQVASTGASWFLFTVHHESWVMLAPNAAFEKIVGVTNRTSERDIPLELHKALNAKNVRLMLYVNIRMDPASATPNEVRTAMGGWPPNAKLIDNITAVYREYSLRYGNKVSGWWVDAAGLKDYRESPHRERWLKQIADALRAGNPNAIVAFNSGVRMERYSQSDYTAGEMNDLAYIPNGRWVDGSQWHALTFLGGWWGSGETRFSNSELIDYTTKVVANGGALTYDIGTLGFVWKSRKDKPSKNPHAGYMDPAQVEQMTQVIRAAKQKELAH